MWGLGELTLTSLLLTQQKSGSIAAQWRLSDDNEIKFSKPFKIADSLIDASSARSAVQFLQRTSFSWSAKTSEELAIHDPSDL
jgi:hypothetical protein